VAGFGLRPRDSISGKGRTCERPSATTWQLNKAHLAPPSVWLGCPIMRFYLIYEGVSCLALGCIYQAAKIGVQNRDNMPSPFKSVPFAENDSPVSKISNSLTADGTTQDLTVASLDLPAFYFDHDRNLTAVNPNQPDEFRRYLAQELDVTRLLLIYKHLWLAGQPRAARPFHYHIMIGRKLIITENADRHLTWDGSQMYIKPLPTFLLIHNIWKDHLCSNQLLNESATGFLLSYMWLICTKADFNIAQAHKLISSEISWSQWVAFSAVVLRNIDHTGMLGVNPRYFYGELRISRLNWIWRFLYRPFSLTNMVRGYSYGFRQYSVFTTKSFAWLLGSFFYITVVLTAMQVGLATERLDKNRQFQDASYGFTVFSILAPLLGCLLIAVVLLFLVIFNLVYTAGLYRTRKEAYAQVRQNEALVQISSLRARDPKHNTQTAIKTCGPGETARNAV
jgi:hypothetical protein